MLSKREFWNRIIQLHENNIKIEALKMKQFHHYIIHTDYKKQKYIIRYKSGNKIYVYFDHIYKIYEEIFKNNYVDNSYMKMNSKRIYGRSWTAPGSAMLAEITVIDPNIHYKDGTLFSMH